MKKIIVLRLVIVFFIVLMLGCAQDKKAQTLPDNHNILVPLQYAEGFSIMDNGDFKILEINNPWPYSDESFRYAIINRSKAASITLPRDAYDGIVLTPVNNIVVTSTTHLPALELLGVENTLIGFPETTYVSSEKIRKLIDNKKIKELGKNEKINTEVLIELNPELLVAFGVNSGNRILDEIIDANIAVIYNGDWVEKSPLAKAEWIKFFGLLYEKEIMADSIFKSIETDYQNAKKLALNAKISPTALSGAMHRDVWYLPGGASTEAQLFKDAHINYLWQDTESHGSLELSFESVLEKGSDAELWFSPSYFKSYKDLEEASSHYTQFRAFKNRKIYSFVNTKGKTGGILYYELGFSRPDLVLKDLIKIAHPYLLSDYDTLFFKPLE